MSPASARGSFPAARLHPLPDGIFMFAPTKFLPFATTGLFSWPGKVRMAMDLFIPPKKVAPGEFNDETLESFVVRRMGRECLDRLAEPLVGGVHASDPSRMSLAATFPRLLEMEQNYGSLMKGFLAARRKVEEMRRKYPPKAGREAPDVLHLISEGNAGTHGPHGRCGGSREDANREDRSSGSGAKTPAHGAPRSPTAPRSMATRSSLPPSRGPPNRSSGPTMRIIADALAGIPASSSGTVSVAFNEKEVGFDLNAFGVLCPLVEGRALMAATYSSTKWPGRAPPGKVLLRGFVGGPHNQEILKRSDDELVQTVIAEFRDILGLNPFAKPLFSRVFRWHLGMPQYTLGHLDRISRIDDRCARIPGLAIAGGSYRGVGVPNCIESGERAVSKVLGEWGIDLAEDRAEEKRYY